VVITGSPDSSGGVVMEEGTASFGPPGDPGQYQGRVVELRGSSMVLALSSPTAGPLELRVQLSIAGSQVTGQLTSATAGQGGIGDDY